MKFMKIRKNSIRKGKHYEELKPVLGYCGMLCVIVVPLSPYLDTVIVYLVSWL